MYHYSTNVEIHQTTAKRTIDVVLSDDEEKTVPSNKKSATIIGIASKLTASFYEEDDSETATKLYKLEPAPLAVIHAINEKYFDAGRIEKETNDLLDKLTAKDIEKQVQKNRKRDRFNSTANNGRYTTPKKVSCPELRLEEMQLKKQAREAAKWSLQEKFLQDYEDYESVISSN